MLPAFTSPKAVTSFLKGLILFAPSLTLLRRARVYSLAFLNLFPVLNCVSQRPGTIKITPVPVHTEDEAGFLSATRLAIQPPSSFPLFLLTPNRPSRVCYWLFELQNMNLEWTGDWSFATSGRNEIHILSFPKNYVL